MKTDLRTCRRFFRVAAGFLAILPIVSFAQTAPVKQWDKTFGGPLTDRVFKIRQTTDGGYISGGQSATGPGGDKTQAGYGLADFWVIKQDAAGNKTWDKSFGGTGTEMIQDLIQTSDGGYLLAGLSSSGVSTDKSQPSRGSQDYWILKIDANGSRVWDKSFGGTGYDHLYKVVPTADGGYLLGGLSDSPASGDKTHAAKGAEDFWIVKIDGAGNFQWDKAFGGTGLDQLIAMQQTADGGYILGGNSDSGISGDKSQASKGLEDFWLVKLDASGNKLWDKTLGGDDSDFLNFIYQTPAGDYIVGGNSYSGASGDKNQRSWGSADGWVVKLDGAGNKLWDATYGGTGEDGFGDLQPTNGGGFILGGYSNSAVSGTKTAPQVGGVDFWLVKINALGNQLWDQTYGGNGDENIASLAQTLDGGYALAGPSDSGTSSDKSQPAVGLKDYWIVKLAPEVLGIKEKGADLKISVFPNPNQGKFRLECPGVLTAGIEVSVFDLLGRKILQQELPAGGHQISEEMEVKAPKGVYLLQLKAENQTTTRRLVIE